MNKHLHHIVLIFFFIISGLTARGDFDPVAGNELYPRGGDASSSNIGSPLETYCDPGNTETFSVDAVDDGTLLDEAIFEWVVFGGSISASSGVVQLSVNNVVGGFNRQYLKTKGVNGSNKSSITFQTDNPLPDTIWVAVRQTSQYGCSDGKWAVYLMKSDDEIPTEANMPLNVANLAWEQPYSFTIPTVTDNCIISSFTMSINGVETDVIGMMGDTYTPDLIREAPGDVNNDGKGVDNTLVFRYSDGIHDVETTRTIHVNYRSHIELNTAINPSCIGSEDGEIEVTAQVETESGSVQFKYSTDNLVYTNIGSAFRIFDLPQGDYYFTFSSMVNGYTTYSDTLKVTLLDPPPIIFSNPNSPGVITPELCLGAKNGTISLDIDYARGASNPFRPYRVKWELDANPFTVTATDSVNLIGLEHGTYRITVTDAAGCDGWEEYPVIIDNSEPPVIIDPSGMVAGVFTHGVDAGTCGLVIDTALYHIDPTATDGACTTGLTLEHDYVAPYNTLNGKSFPVGSASVTWTAADASLNSVTKTYSIVIQDNIPPSINDQADTIYPNCLVTRAIPLPVVSDNCALASVTCNLTGATNWLSNILDNEKETTPITFNPAAITAVTWTVTDIYGLISTDSYNISFTSAIQATSDFKINDVACSYDTYGSIVIDFTGGKPPYDVVVESNTIATDSYLTNFVVSNLLPNTYTVRITDADGCYLDVIAVINKPSPITATVSSRTDNVCFEETNGALNLNVGGGNGGYTGYNWTGPTYDAYADGHPWSLPPSVTFAVNSKDQASLPTGRYNLTVTDAKNCTGSFSFDVNATDATAPTYSFDGGGTTVTRNLPNGQCTYNVLLAEFDPTTSDNCPVVKWHNVKPSGPGATAPDSLTLAGATFPRGTTNVLWHIYDHNGNGANVTVSYVIADNQPPVFNIPPADITKSVISGCNYTLVAADYAMTYSDNCTLPANALTYKRSDNNLLTLSDPFSVRPIPDTIIWTLTDASGLTATDSQLVKIEDHILPVIDCSTPLTVYLSGNIANPNDSITREDYLSTISDNCSQFDTIYADRTDLLPVKSRTFTCADIGQPRSIEIYAVDIWGNVGHCTRSVIVRDTVAPVVNTKPATIFINPLPTTPVTLTPSLFNDNSVDNCTAANALSFKLWYNNRVQNDTTFNCSGVGGHTLTLQVTDASGNFKRVGVQVTVKDTIAPNATKRAAPPTFILNQDGERVVTKAQFTTQLVQSISDNCTPYANLILPPLFTLTCTTTSVDLTMEDAYGNKRTVNVPVNVVDQIKPTIQVKDAIIQLDGAAVASKTLSASSFDIGSSDACGSLTFTIDGAASKTFYCANVGENMVTIRATDPSGNFSEYQAKVTVQTPVVINNVSLNVCGSAKQFVAQITPAISGSNPTSNYTWSWRLLNSPPTSKQKIFMDTPTGTAKTTSTVASPYFKEYPGYTPYLIGLTVSPINSNCPSVEYVYDFNTNNGAHPASETFYEVDACLNDIKTYQPQFLSGTPTCYVWTINTGPQLGTIIGATNQPQITVQWNTLNNNYDNPGVTCLVFYGTCGNSCWDSYVWYPNIVDMPQPQFVTPVITTVCPLEQVTYTLTSSAYSRYNWDPVTKGTVVAGGNPTDNSITIKWDATLGVTTDFVKVIVHNIAGCLDSVQTGVITIADGVAPTWPGEVASSYNRTLLNQASYCSVMLTDLPIPTAADYCNGNLQPVANITRTFTIRNKTTLAVQATGNDLNYNLVRLPVGDWTVTWVAKDIGNNASADFIYEIIVTDTEPPVFTTNPNDFYADADATCKYTHQENPPTVVWNLSATDNCGILANSVYCTVGNDLVTHHQTLSNVQFSNSLTTVIWHASDVNGHDITHTYTVHLNDKNYPTFTFGATPTDNGVYNYEGVFEALEKFYIFANSEAQTYSISIPADIRDACSMGEVSVTVTDPNGTVRPKEVLPPPSSGSIYTFTGSVNLGASTVKWSYSDATGNVQTVEHTIVFASKYGFDCSVTPYDMWNEVGRHECNPIPAQFLAANNGSIVTAELPSWFDPLFTGHILDYSFGFNGSMVALPPGSECAVTQQKMYNGLYQIKIYGSSTSQLDPAVTTDQWYHYFIDTTVPSLNTSSKKDLELECGDPDYVTKISDWLDNLAGVTVSDICSTTGNISKVSNYGSLTGTTCGAGSITTVTFTITDECGNFSTFTADIKFNDTVKPSFTNMSGTLLTPAQMPRDSIGVNAVPCSRVPVPPDFLGSDICGGMLAQAIYNEVRTNGSCTDNYRLTRTWTVTDPCGNDSTWTQLIDVVDNVPPVWLGNVNTLPKSYTVSCNSIPVPPVFTYSDNCDNFVTYNYSSTTTQNPDKTLSGYYNYMIVRTWSIQDNCNVPVIHRDTVNVRDINAPVITSLVRDSTVECDGAGNIVAYNSWLANHGKATATDNCAPNNLTWNNNSSNLVAAPWAFSCGPNDNAKFQNVVFSVSDPSGNTATDMATFIIRDQSKPIIVGALATINNLSEADTSLAPNLPYTTVAQMESANPGFSVNDVCSSKDFLTVTYTRADSKTGSGCTYNIIRTYTITDPCGNQSSTVTQTLKLKDGVKPQIIQSLSYRTSCATNSSTQMGAVNGLALKADSIWDNCNPPEWFLDPTNIASGSIQYSVNHTNNAYDVPWTNGNPNSLDFYEGKSQVYFRLKDQNGNSITKTVYEITIEHMPVITDVTTTEPTGIVGGADNPLHYSTHRYTVTMAQLSNLLPGPAVLNTGFKIYPTGNRATPFAAGTAYTITLGNVGNVVTATITFDGTLPEGGVYDLVFVEQNAGGCNAEEFFTFTLGAPFDVDINEVADDCPAVDNQILSYGVDVQANGRGTTSTFDYVIALQSSYQNNWSFHYDVTIGEEGSGTNDATVNSVIFSVLNGASGNLAVNTATHIVTVTYNVPPNTTTQIGLRVVYGDVHGTTQVATVSLTNITGSASEEDLNVILGTVNDEAIGNSDGNSDQNNVMHRVNNLPLPHNVVGVE